MKKKQPCHSSVAAATEESLWDLNLRKSRFLASLGMTKKEVLPLLLQLLKYLLKKSRVRCQASLAAASS
jgi:hypothetical protein